MKRWTTTARTPRLLRAAVVATFTAGSLVALVAPAAAATTVTDCPATETALVADIGAAGAGGTVSFTCATDTTIAFTTPITVSSDITLDASGAAGTVAFDGGVLTEATEDSPDSGTPTRLLSVAAGATLDLNGLTLQNARDLEPGFTTEQGGAIFNAGTLNATGTTFTGNANVGPQNVPVFPVFGWTTTGGSGAAIYNTGIAHITASTFSHNASEFDGAAIWSSGTLSVGGDSTFYENTIPDENAGNQQGSAIYSSGELSVGAATFTGNYVDIGSGDQGQTIAEGGGTASLTGITFAPDSNRTPLFADLGISYLVTILAGHMTVAGGEFDDTTLGAFEVVDSNASLTIGDGTTFAPGGGGINDEFGGPVDVDGLTMTGLRPINTLGAQRLTLSNDTFTGYSSSAVVATSAVTLSDSTFSGNAFTGDTDTDALAVVGPGSTVERTSFSDNTGVSALLKTAGGDVSVEHTTFTDNHLVTGDPIDPSGNDRKSGAPLLNTGTVTVQDSTFSGNVVENTYNQIGRPGPASGGITNFGTLTVRDTSFTGNTSSGPDGSGAAIANAGTATLTGDTLSGNVSSDGAGGVLNYHVATSDISDSTFFDNTGPLASAVYQVTACDNCVGNQVTIMDSTLVGNTPLADNVDLDGVEISPWTVGYSIISGPTFCDPSVLGSGRLSYWDDSGPGFNITDEPAQCWRGSNADRRGSETHDVTGADLELDPAGLADNGGPTQTVKLEPGSPAIDFVSGADACTGADQRGVPRAAGTGETACDAGAYESSYVTTATALSASTPTSVSGEPVAFTATVSITDPSATADQAIASGSVQFHIDGTDAGAPVALDAEGTAVFSTSTLGVGSHTVTATFAESGDYLASTSATVNETVTRAATTTTLQSSVNPAVLGQPVTLTATVDVTAPGGGPVTGSVIFTDGTSELGTAPVTTSAGAATATLTSSALGLGTHQLTATYPGSDTLTGSSSPALNATVGMGSQTISVATDASTSATVGDHLIVSASSSAGLPVNYTIGAGTSNNACSIEGTTVSFDHAGTCEIDYDQPGNDDYNAAPAVAQTITVATIGSTVAVSVDPSASVYGQSVTATAQVTSGPGSVQFTVDGTDVGAPVTVTGGTATSGNLAPLDRGAHTIGAVFTPEDSTVYSSGSATGALAVSQAATRTTVVVHPKMITATVVAVAPGAGSPTGPVTFTVGGHTVGSVLLTGGTATLSYNVPNGRKQAVAAAYSGDTDFAGSSASTSRNDPTISAHVSSSVARSKYGWYRAPVTVSFTCTTNGAPLIGRCPPAVTLKHDGAGQSVTRTIAATDGGTATVSVRGLNIDRTAPTVRVTGVRSGAVYFGSAPRARCAGNDRLSGVASCTLTRRTTRARNSYTVDYTARATDRAGNRTTITGHYTVETVYFASTPFNSGAYTVRTGRTYTLVLVGASHRPVYYDATVYPQRPRRRDNAFHAAGHDRWALGITMQRGLRSHRYWNVGVKIGNTLHVIKIRIV